MDLNQPGASFGGPTVPPQDPDPGGSQDKLKDNIITESYKVLYDYPNDQENATWDDSMEWAGPPENTTNFYNLTYDSIDNTNSNLKCASLDTGRDKQATKTELSKKNPLANLLNSSLSRDKSHVNVIENISINKTITFKEPTPNVATDTPVNGEFNNISNTSRVAGSGGPTSTHSAALINKYKTTDTGPYYVFLENTESGNLGYFHPMAMGKMIFVNIPDVNKEIVNISAAGRNKVKIETKTGAAANNILLNTFLKTQNIKCYIPDSLVNKKGVIRNVHKELSETEIMSVIKSNSKVKAVKRVTKKIKNVDKTEEIILGTCILTFDSQKLPAYVYIHGTRCMVDPYVAPVLQCYNCMRFGHGSKQCRSKARCGICGSEHNSRDCLVKEPVCVLCNEGHVAFSKKCPVYQKQLETKKNKVFTGNDYQNQTALSFNPYYALMNYNDDFPALRKPAAQNDQRSYIQSYRKDSYKKPQIHNQPNTSANTKKSTNIKDDLEPPRKKLNVHSTNINPYRNSPFSSTENLTINIGCLKDKIFNLFLTIFSNNSNNVNADFIKNSIDSIFNNSSTPSQYG